ncbi:putative T-complex protein 1 subunit delta [Cocos nucifera]|uniref:Putative T-complex protein 1 subunit delta n=1 Tax=Cocos nucifera TaxID=13894 RepID=A0A8K0MYG7_COCNU|nr:putative T-complex protein 1 subunit delta [Cocos nucifera]
MVFQMQPYGIQAIQAMLKEHLSGLDEAVLKNIDACNQLSVITRTSLGSNGFTFVAIAVFAGGVDTSATETKGTVLIHNAEQLENYAKTEEAKVEELIKAVADSGAKVTIVKNEEGGNSVSTVVLRGSTDSILDDLERAVDDGVNTYKAMCRDSRIVPGAAATEIELARKLKEFSFKETGLDQYAIAKFAESFEMVPMTLAENAGLNTMEIISSLYAEHAAGNTKVGIDLEGGVCKDVSTMNIWDLYLTK